MVFYLQALAISTDTRKENYLDVITYKINSV